MTSICICGAGTMGTGIAQVCAQSGFKTLVFDLNKNNLQNAQTQLVNSLALLNAKGKITGEQKERFLSSTRFVSDINECCADLVIEAVSENIGVKIELFTKLAGVNQAAAIFASNTSSLSISAIQRQLPFGERVVGMHFFNPAPKMKLVEVIKGVATGEAAVAMVLEFCKATGKVAVLCNDSPGFIVNRVARPYYLESLRLLEKGMVSFGEIDSLLEASGFRMGPFRLMDLIGIDINLSVSQGIYQALGEPKRLGPSAVQKDKVAAGKWGIKTGSGFYDY